MSTFRNHAGRLAVAAFGLWAGFGEVSRADAANHWQAARAPHQPHDSTQTCSMTVGANPILRITSPEADPGMFFRLSGGVLLHGSGVVVTSSGTHSVLRFDSSGKLTHDYGRKGEGPSDSVRLVARGE